MLRHKSMLRTLNTQQRSQSESFAAGSVCCAMLAAVGKDGRVVRGWCGYEKDDRAVTQARESLKFKEGS